MTRDKYRVFTRINQLFLVSMSLYYLTKLVTAKLFYDVFDLPSNAIFSMAVALVVSYLPYFIENNFKDTSHPRQSRLTLTKKDYFIFIIFILLINVFSYFFISGIEHAFNNIRLSIVKQPIEVYKLSQSILVMAYSILLVPIIEELIYRAFILRKLEVYGSGFAIIISSLLFGLSHGNIPQFITAFFLGLVLGYVYVLTHSKKTVIILHIFNNSYTSLYNLFIYQNIGQVEYIQIFVIIELVITILLAIYALYQMRKQSHLRLNHASTSNILLFKYYFFRLTTILIFVFSFVTMFRSISILGGSYGY